MYSVVILCPVFIEDKCYIKSPWHFVRWHFVRDPRHTKGDESFRAISCTSTDNQTQKNKTKYTEKTQKVTMKE